MSTNPNDLRTWSLKLIIIGNPSVGKTSLRRAYLGEKFRINYIATIGADFSFKQIVLGNDHINTSIWDLAGQEETFANIHPQYYKGSAGALVVYDVTSRETFEKVGEWIEKYQSLTGDQTCPILVVGNKTDVLDASSVSEDEQEKHVEELRDKFNHQFPILSSRTSAKTGDAINSSFRSLVNKIVELQKERIEPRNLKEKDIGNYLPTSYFLTFHDIYGPRILARTKSIDHVDPDKEFGSAIKISSILDFDDVIKFAQVTGSTPWTSPEGIMYYIAFTIDNDKARGGKSLLICGFVATREIREVISQFQSVIDGTLHSGMNEIVRIVSAETLDLTSEHSNDPEENIVKLFEEVIFDLRYKIFEIIKSRV